MGDNTYNLKYCIGHNGNLGLLEDFERNGDVRIRLKEGTILECAEIVRTLHRFSMFMNSQAEFLLKELLCIMMVCWQGGFVLIIYVKITFL